MVVGREVGVLSARSGGSPAGAVQDERPDAAAAYRALAPAVLGYLRGRHVPDPEDLLGEVFLQVSRDLDRFTGDASDLRRWVFTIARNRVIDQHRRRGRRPEVLVGEGLEGDESPPPPEPTDPELLAALDGLTEDQREVVLLRFVADLSLDEVAAMTQRSVGAVKSMQHRALDVLRDALDATDRGGG